MFKGFTAMVWAGLRWTPGRTQAIVATVSQPYNRADRSRLTMVHLENIKVAHSKSSSAISRSSSTTITSDRTWSSAGTQNVLSSTSLVLYRG